MTDRTRTPTWVYIAAGCGGAIVLALVALGVVGYLGYRWVEDVKETHEDPASREAKVLEVLGAESIPEGYYSAAGVSIPFVMQLAVLSDREPKGDGRSLGFDERGFIYLEMIRLGGRQDELEAFFRGEIDDAEVLRENNIRIDVEEVVGRGSIEGESFDLDYFAHRGGLEAAGGRGRGLTSLVMIRCPSDERMRLGIWFGPDPDVGTPVESLDTSGTVADEGAISRFFGQFAFCPA